MYVCKNNTENALVYKKKLYIRLFHTVENNLNDLRGNIKSFLRYKPVFLFTVKKKL